MSKAKHIPGARVGAFTPRRIAEPRFRLIAEAVASELGVPLGAILQCGCQEHRFVRARQMAHAIARKLTSRSTVDIGRYIGRCHSTTVIHGARETEKRLATDPQLVEKLTRIVAAIEIMHAAEVAARMPPADASSACAASPEPAATLERAMKPLRSADAAHPHARVGVSGEVA